MSDRGHATIRALREDVAALLARHVTRLGISQTAAARQLAIPQPTLSKIVHGRVRDLSLELLLRIAVRAGVTVSVLTGREPSEAGAFASSTRSARGRARNSVVANQAREALLESERRLSPAERLNAFIEQSELLCELREAGRAAERRRLATAARA